MSGPATLTRDQLLAAIVEFISSDDLLPIDQVRASLGGEIDRAGPEALVNLHDRLTTDRGWGYYPPDPLARRIHHLLAHRFLERDSEVHDAGLLDRLPAARVVILSNHLSYADANVIEVLLRRVAAGAVADRLTAIAGPKVFASRQRRFSSLCFGTIKVPQSADVSSGEARLHARDVARAARQALDAARSRLDAGDVLLLFPEGTRSRNGQMNRLLAGAARYLEEGGTSILPVGLAGSEALFPIESTCVHPARVRMYVGMPMAADALLAAADGDRRLAMDAAGLALSDLLPAGYKGVYAEGSAFTNARDVLVQAQNRS